MPLDYSRWDHIEVSDDEDDTHPNIDTQSLFRWRHKARIERDEEWNKEKEKFATEYKAYLTALQKAKQELEKAKSDNKPSSTIDELTKKYAQLQKEEKHWEESNVEMQKKERLRPWNIDTICHEGKSFTAINHVEEKSETDQQDDETSVVDRLKAFVEKYDKDIKKFGMFQRPQDTQEFLVKNPHLVCDETANQLVLWCIDLAMEEKISLMNHVSHQCIILQFMLELAKTGKRDPRGVIRPFFSKFMDPEPEYMKAFNAELDAFRERIQQRAKVRLQEAMDKLEEEERQQRLGPGGLDPLEVMNSLPPELQKCFETKDVEMLKNVLTSLPEKDANYHLQRCIDSGLWVENAGNASEANADEPTAEAT